MTVPSPKLRRRFLRFSLQAMLLLVAVICVAFGLISFYMHKVRQQRVDVAALEKLECQVYFGGPTVVPRWMEYVLGDQTPKNVIVVDCRNCGARVTDAELVHLEGMSQLSHLYLWRTEVTDAGLVHLQRLTHLEYLNLTGTRVTNAGKQELQKALPSCQIVHVQIPP